VLPAFPNTSTLGAKLQIATMIQVDGIRDTLKRLERLMYGHNFEVTFGIEIFEACDNYIKFMDRLKKRLPEALPENQTLIPHDFDSVIAAIQVCFDYRGDVGAGLVLTERRNQQVLIEQQKYLAFVSAFSAGAVNAFSYPDETGIPGYPVWWDFRFILFNEKKQCLFIYGAASD
jgi:hypothetical protein